MEDLLELRRTAQDLSRAERWPEFLDLVPRLRGDEEFWASYWAPMAAIGAGLLGRPEKRRLLQDAIDAGFCQPEIFEPELTGVFGADEDWPELLARMAANVPPPTLELLSWPTLTPMEPLELFRLTADREELLRARIPAPEPTAWATAQTLLRWVSTRWTHNNEHVDRPDAVELLDRVDAGERFACSEYSILLTQALNASGIPARQVGLRKANHHTGMGGGHVVTEAWIDDLGRWVVLDGQNGMFWSDVDGTPLGLLELMDRFHSGGPPSAIVCLAEPQTEAARTGWWMYFAAAYTTGAAWVEHGFVPMVDGRFYRSPRLIREASLAYPDLAELAVSIAVTDDVPLLRPHLRHPFATAVRVTDGDSGGEVPVDGGWPLRLSPAGDHHVELAVVTPFGVLRPAEIRYRTAE
ncbi:transglutaminase-like putative cysteine protease [Allocatelliglobosispora scoriae]|uniref:Transglutaminase-like putative cysteine protease n=1 Tax=Allocatelliglobosispora scoriae TaxID=643052 RepID=A0A841BLW2_9ACTN|nr:transglutaminase domain-containing protein [Allocatelliglobosispora scoriae]MBB5867963.1 transglutaminase-like putative cysteine protease [Allocatelliglobosispora scoriae]